MVRCLYAVLVAPKIGHVSRNLVHRLTLRRLEELGVALNEIGRLIEIRVLA